MGGNAIFQPARIQIFGEKHPRKGTGKGRKEEGERKREKGGEEMHCGYWSYPWFRSCLVLSAISSLWRIIW